MYTIFIILTLVQMIKVPSYTNAEKTPSVVSRDNTNTGSDHVPDDPNSFTKKLKQTLWNQSIQPDIKKLALEGLLYINKLETIIKEKEHTSKLLQENLENLNKEHTNELSSFDKYLECSRQSSSLNFKLEISEKKRKTYEIVLGLRSVIKFLPNYLWPFNVKKPPTRQDAWVTLLECNDKVFVSSVRIMELRNRIIHEKRLSLEIFLHNVFTLYREIPKTTAVNLPENITDEDIISAFEIIVGYKKGSAVDRVRGCDDKDLKTTIEILVTPILSIQPPTNNDIGCFRNIL